MLKLTDVVKDKRKIEGDKVPINSILDKELVFTDWSINESKFDGKVLCLQFESDKGHNVIFTGSKVLIDQVLQFEYYVSVNKLERKFLGTIKQIDNYYKIC